MDPPFPSEATVGGVIAAFGILALIGREMYRARHRQPAQARISEAEAKLPPGIREMLIALRLNPSDVHLNRNMQLELIERTEYQA